MNDHLVIQFLFYSVFLLDNYTNNSKVSVADWNSANFLNCILTFNQNINSHYKITLLGESSKKIRELSA